MSSSHSQTQPQAATHGPTLGGYLTGFVLALVLTLIPFGVVAFAGLSTLATLLVIAVAAVLQILVHLRFFLHLDMSEEQRWNTVFAGFTVVILFMLVGGTLWLFFSLYARM